MLFADMLSLHLVTFLMFFILVYIGIAWTRKQILPKLKKNKSDISYLKPAGPSMF